MSNCILCNESVISGYLIHADCLDKLNKAVGWTDAREWTERLTIYDGCGNADLKCCMECGDGCGNSNENCGNCEKPYEAYERLAAYKDAGFVPGTKVYILYDDIETGDWGIEHGRYIGYDDKNNTLLVDVGAGESFELVDCERCDVFTDIALAETERRSRNNPK